MARLPFHSDISPWQDLREMRDQMDRFLSSAFRGIGLEPSGTWTPAVDITEREDALVLTAELPGMSRDDVQIELENNVLTIRGEKREEREEKGEERYVYERRFGSFARSFTLPKTVDADRIHARFENGVLTVTLPKSERERGRRIEIEEGRQAHD